MFASLLEYAAVGYIMKRRRMSAPSGTTPTSETSLMMKPVASKPIDPLHPLNATMHPFYGSVDRRLDPVGHHFDSDCDCHTVPHSATPSSPSPYPRSSRHIPPTRPFAPTPAERQKPLTYFSRQRQSSLPHPGVLTPHHQHSVCSHFATFYFLIFWAKIALKAYVYAFGIAILLIVIKWIA